jgi:tyrosinase
MLHIVRSFVLFFAALAVAGPVCTPRYIVTGATGGVNNATGERPTRQDIQVFKDSGAAFDLFVLALQTLQERSQDDKYSWYQFAGIHGRPYIAWGGVQGVQELGYATHNSILFGSWHRTFLAAYEQLISETANSIAAQYPDSEKQEYLNAASTLRIPFWDWASYSTMSSVVTDANITVNTPQGQQTIANPLTGYTFHPHPSTSDFPPSDGVSLYNQTVRTPDSNGNPQIGAANVLLQQNAAVTTDKTYLLIARQTDYGAFSTTAWPADRRNGSYDSLESIHNQMHALVGGLGHMGFIPYSSFDPIFFMHHANVDRLMAIFQAINPSSYVTPLGNDYGTFTENPGIVEDVHSALTPFRKDSGSFHTSVTAQATKNFGYTYPEVVDWGVGADQLAANTRAAFNKLYNPTGALTRRSVPRNQRRVTNSSSTREWYVNLSVQRRNIATFIDFFLGAPPTDASQWATANNLVVSQAILSDMASGTGKAPYIAQVPLTRSLVGNGQDPTNVNVTIGYLQNALQYRCRQMDGTVIECDTFPSLNISVVDQVVQLSNSTDQFHSYGTFNAHPELVWSS